MPRCGPWTVTPGTSPWPGGTATYRAVGGAPEGATRVPAISLARLLQEHARGGAVDYLKVDVEGGERELLLDGSDWAPYVRAIKVEVHAPYTPQACEQDLRRLGFSTRIDRRHWACVEGVYHSTGGTSLESTSHRILPPSPQPREARCMRQEAGREFGAAGL
jgi:Methyltransferase FkbM domain